MKKILKKEGVFILITNIKNRVGESGGLWYNSGR